MDAVEAQDIGGERTQTRKDARIAADPAGVLGEATVTDVVGPMVSRPEEFHLRPLVELCVRLSPHTAPIRRTRRQFPSASVRTDAGFSARWPRGRHSPVSGDLKGV